MRTALFIFFGLAALAFLAMPLLMFVRARKLRGKPVPALPPPFDLAAAPGKALFYFSSPSCSMCRAMDPVISAIGRDHPRVFKIDVTRESAVARAFGILATPASVLVENGMISAFLIGPQPEARLRRWLEE